MGLSCDEVNDNLQARPAHQLSYVEIYPLNRIFNRMNSICIVKSFIIESEFKAWELIFHRNLIQNKKVCMKYKEFSRETPNESATTSILQNPLSLLILTYQNTANL